jgi:hypothetical protein
VKYLCLFGRLEASLYPGSRNAIVEILSVVAPGVRQEECVQKCEYRLNCTDGAFPRQGYEAFNLRPKFFIDVEADRSQAAES